MRIVLLLFAAFPVFAAHDVALKIKLSCPMSQELLAFEDSIPDQQSADFEEWRAHFVASMHKLIVLVESGKIDKACWKVNTGTQFTAKNNKKCN